METTTRRTPGAHSKVAAKAAVVVAAKLPARRRAAALAPRPDRRLAILLAAERLFAQRGYHAVSIRQIADDAGVPLALVSYYFGQKHELFHAIFERWSYTITERIEALRVAERTPHDDAKLHLIVRAFITPVLRLRASEEGEYYALLITVGLSMQQGSAADSVLREFFDPMADAFIGVLHETLRADTPHVTRSTVAWCYQFALGALLHHISDVRVDRLSMGANKPNDSVAAPMLVDFIVHGIRGVVASLPAPRTSRRRPS